MSFIKRRPFQNFIFNFKIGNMIGARVIESENDDGVVEEGLFIPMEINGLERCRNTITMKISLVESIPTSKQWGSHWAMQRTSQKHREKLNEMGYSHPPYVGYMYRMGSMTPTQEVYCEVNNINYK